LKGNCGSPKHPRNFFERMQSKNSFVRTSAIASDVRTSEAMADGSFARQYTAVRGPKAPDWDKGIRCRLAVVWAKVVLLVCMLFVCMIPVIIIGACRRSIAFLVSVKRSTARLVFTHHSPSELPVTAPKVNETALDESGKPCDISHEQLSHHAVSRRRYLTSLSEIVGPAEEKHWLYKLRALLLAWAAEFSDPITRVAVVAIMSSFSSRELYLFFRYTLLPFDLHARNMVLRGTWPSDLDAFAVVFLVSMPGIPDFLGCVVRAPEASATNLRASAAALHAMSAAFARAGALAPDVPDVYLPLTAAVQRTCTPLAEAEPALARWGLVKSVEGNVTSSAIVCPPLLLTDGAVALSPDGWRDSFHDGSVGRVIAPSARDIVCISARGRTESGFHAPQHVVGNRWEDYYALPPNTYLTLVRVQQAPFVVQMRRWRFRQCAALRASAPPETILDDRGGADGRGPWRFYVEVHTTSGKFFAETFPASPCDGPKADLDAKMLPPTAEALRVAEAHAVTLEALGYDEFATYPRTIEHGRLLTCTCTYQNPADRSRDEGKWYKHQLELQWFALIEALQDKALRNGGATATKYAESVAQLCFLDRTAYVRGTSDLTSQLTHQMEDEWRRADRWSDWQV